MAETATLLVEGDMGALLQRHRFELGVYATYPDSVFRRQDAGESPLHYLELDGKEGKLPQRAQQLFKLAASEWEQVKRPTGSFMFGNPATGEIKHVFMGLYYMGLLAHYSGDAAVPHHATADRNGFAEGQGGVHYFYEGDCVYALGPSLEPAVAALAKANEKAWVATWKGEPDKMVLGLLQDSLAAIPGVLAADKPSILEPSKGTTMAKRKPAAQACQAQRDSIVERLAKGAVLTAALWRRAIGTRVDFSQSGTLQLNDLNDRVTWFPLVL